MRHVSHLRFAGQCAIGIFLVCLLTLCGLGLHWNLSTATLIYLLLVVICAVRFGFWQASVISVAAVVVQGYCFAPPEFSFYIADPRNGVAILVFELTALLVGRLSSRERAHAIKLEQQRRSLQQLFAVSRGGLLLNPHASPVQQMAELILRECGFDAVAILDAGHGELKTAGRWPSPPAALAERVVAEHSSAEQLPEVSTINDSLPGLAHRRLLIANQPIGALLVLSPHREVDPLTMDALASLIALTFDRYRAFHGERAAEAARQTEQLRTTVLDGLAHAFKTPLTIIRAASSGLLEMGHLDYMQQELTTIIDTESMRLNELATRLLQTARADDEKVVLEREIVSIAHLIREVAASATREWAENADQYTDQYTDQHAAPGDADTPRVQVVLEGKTANDNLEAMADYDMLTATIRELLENAAKYSTAGSPILVRASRSHTEVLVSVHNRGPVIPLEDRERIFERFYRCPLHRYSAPGTGIGLAMARNTLHAHGGHIWVISGEHQGTTFTFSLPRSLPATLPNALPSRHQAQRTQKLEAR
jgi:two-component system sensor histidine kinase KdpD